MKETKQYRIQRTGDRERWLYPMYLWATRVTQDRSDNPSTYFWMDSEVIATFRASDNWEFIEVEPATEESLCRIKGEVIEI